MQSLEAVKEQKKEKQVTVSDIVKRPMMVSVLQQNTKSIIFLVIFVLV